MHLGSSPPQGADNPTVQGVIGYVEDGSWHYVSVPALFAQMAAETAVGLALQVHAVAVAPHTDPTDPAELTELGRDQR